MTTRWLIGLASGSSADGVDAALVQADGVGLELRARVMLHLHQSYAADLRDLIRRVSTPGQAVNRQVGLLHRLLGETFAAATRQVADRASLSLQEVQCVGCPGHTAWHEPDGRFPFTFPLGMPAVVAERTGLTTVSDFRSRDLAVGGQGVPLSALADYLLLNDSAETRVLVDLGGLSRVVFLPGAGRPQDVFGFEAGPCNLLLDALVRRLSGGKDEFDPGGKNAVQGRCVEPLLARWLAHPYLQRRPPKSLARQTFGEEFVAQTLLAARTEQWSMHDVLCTAAHFVVRAVTTSMQRFLPADKPVHRVLLSGGGVRNGLLWRLLEQQLAPVPLARTDACGLPSEARKAAVVAVLAALTLDGVPANVPAATGAGGARLLGSITPGSSLNWARCLAWMAAQTTPFAAVAA